MISYEEVINTIENKKRFGNLTGCEITKIMLERLNHPEKGLPFLHIAGTNGKGSVAAFLCSILKEAGFKTGMFTSPHLVDFRERIQINGELISKDDTYRLATKLLEMDFGVSPTMFDYCLAMALLYFKEQQCDVVILETGLGGRFDSTNAVGTPEVSVITKIGFDHMAILGNTLHQIAKEKAGIIKRGTKVVCESQDAGVEEVFTRAAQAAGAKSCKIVDTACIRIEQSENAGEQQFLAYGYEHLTMQMLGVHQYENAATAILAAEAFLEGKTDAKKIKEAVRLGIAKTKWKGRMEILSKTPFFMVDGAHNSHGVAALKESLTTLYPGEKFHFIMGVMADKDYENMIAELLPLPIDFVTVTVENSRSLSAEQLAECIRKKGIPASSKAELKEALAEVTSARRDKTIAFGSLYFIGEIEEKNGF